MLVLNYMTKLNKVLKNLNYYNIMKLLKKLKKTCKANVSMLVYPLCPVYMSVKDAQKTITKPYTRLVKMHI